jgi:hypothetical protein
VSVELVSWLLLEELEERVLANQLSLDSGGLFRYSG